MKPWNKSSPRANADGEKPAKRARTCPVCQMCKSCKSLRAWQVILALALFFWLAQGAFSASKIAFYSSNGLGAQQTLALETLSCESLIPYQGGDDGVLWLVSTDSDPQLHWQGDAYVSTVTVEISYNRPATGAELYYQLDGQDGFSTAQIVYPTVADDGTLVFDLGGKRVSALRIDTESNGGIVTCVESITLNAPTVFWWFAPFVPSAAQWILLVLIPLVTLAMYTELRALARMAVDLFKK